MKKLLLTAVILSVTPIYPSLSAQKPTKPAPKPTKLVQPKIESTPKPINKIKFKLVVAIVRNDGTLVFVPRTDFRFDPYNRTKITEEIIKKNNAPKKPDYSSSYEKNIATCKFYSTELTDNCISKRYDAEMDEWEKVALVGLDEAIKQASGDLPSLKFKTDLTGQAEIELPSGQYYINGDYRFGKSSIWWIDVPVEVKDGLAKFELSNDNAKIFNH